jgi:PKD repeat protein
MSNDPRVRRTAQPRRLVAVLAALAAGVVSLLTGVALPSPAAAADPELAFVAAASAGGSRTAHSVAVPTSVQAGDVLVMVMTWNSTVRATDPSGWTRLRSQTLDGMSARAWTRVATGADAGRNVRVDTRQRAKGVISVVAYRGSGEGARVSASAAASASRTTNHVAPEVEVTDPGSWVVSAWGEESGSAQTWTLPAGTTRRAGRSTSGTAKVSQVVADSDGPVPTGTAAARTARTSLRAGLSAAFSIVVSPGAAQEANTAPTASFTAGCDGLTCELDASSSTDADGDALAYSWDFGDGSAVGAGVTAQHTYADAGRRTVTLTVDDGTDTATATREVDVTAPGPDPDTGPGRQPVPGHTGLVPEGADPTMPLIDEGEIWDIEVIGDRAFVAGGFTSLSDRSGGGAPVAQAYLAAFDLDTGRVDTTFRPVFGNGDVRAVEASPDGSRLFVAGSFTSVNGVDKRRVASLDPVTGAPVAGFTAHANNRATALAVTNSTVYVGGRFATVNGLDQVGLAAVDATTGAVDAGFDNQLSGGIGVNGVLTVQQLQLTHDSATLLVVHTARRIDGQDRYGVGLVDTASKQLLPWRTRLWEDNLQYVGGIQRIYGGDIAPDDSYFVVTSGSGGDRPPINDTAIAFSFEGADHREPLWISRAFDSIYSVAVTERAVYIGGHFQWNESPTAPDPWPGLDDRGYGTGQGLSAYALGDAVVRRDHLGALDPADGKALEWHPGSNSFEGNKAMLATPHGLITGGDGMRQGGIESGRIAFFDLDDLPAPSNPDTTITTPIAGRVVPTGQQVAIQGSATSSGTLQRVQVEVQRGGQYLQDDLTTWGSFNTIFPTLGTRSGQETPWSLPVTFAQSGEMTIRARARNTDGTLDPVKATKKIEAFSFDDLPPTTRITSPGSLFGGSLLASTSFVLRGTATDDKGVESVLLYVRDVATDRYLTASGALVDGYTTFRIDPDVPGSVSTTWEHEVNLPHEGVWKVGAMARDTAGQGDTRWETREYTVDSSGQAPTVRITQPVAVTPPTTSPTLAMAPGGRLTFTGTATDDQALATVEVSLRNETTRDNLAADGSWGSDVINGWYKVSPGGLDQASYDWSFTTPAELVPGTYTFRVRASDKQDLSTSSSMQGRITLDVAVPDDQAPDGLLDVTGTQTSDVLHLDLTGTATDDHGVAGVRVAILENDTDRYLQADGTLAPGFRTVSAALASPGATSTSWSLPVDLPGNGDYSVTAYAVDGSGQLDRSTTGATARYLVYPGDAAPQLLPTLASPTDGTAFTEARIFVSGRAEDDLAIGAVEVAVVDAAGLWMSSTGTFSSTERWVSAFLNSPGSPGSNYSYTTPVIPDGTYRVLVRPVDTNGQYPEPRDVTVTVTAPAGNQAPAAAATVSCDDNVCTFDGRGSTDDNAPTLTYSWSFGNGRTGSGGLATHTFTSAGSFVPSLTVRDEYGLTSTVTLDPLAITEPAGNSAPAAVISPPTCVGLVCNFGGSTSSDPDVGDAFTYAWDFGDGSTSTSANPSRAYAAAGTYSVSLTVTDGWGRASTTSVDVEVAP